jgi:hypothetical protein
MAWGSAKRKMERMASNREADKLVALEPLAHRSEFLQKRRWLRKCKPLCFPSHDVLTRCKENDAVGVNPTDRPGGGL